VQAPLQSLVTNLKPRPGAIQLDLQRPPLPGRGLQVVQVGASLLNVCCMSKNLIRLFVKIARAQLTMEFEAILALLLCSVQISGSSLKTESGAQEKNSHRPDTQRPLLVADGRAEPKRRLTLLL